MFTGIIETVGTVESVSSRGGGRRLRIAAPFSGELRVDQSVSVNGACQTVVAHDAGTFEVIAIEETLAKTTLGRLKAGDRVNLERAMRPSSRLDGHLVQGHVDTSLEVVSVQSLETSWLITLRYAPEHARFLIPVGSIALDGISLTIARLGDDTLSVAIIPHTWDHTIISAWKAGSRVNVEFDLIGKYVARSLGLAGGMAPDRTSAMTPQWLAEQGFGPDASRASEAGGDPAREG